jgi:hypothetical protein
VLKEDESVLVELLALVRRYDVKGKQVHDAPAGDALVEELVFRVLPRLRLGCGVGAEELLADDLEPVRERREGLAQRLWRDVERRRARAPRG